MARGHEDWFINKQAFGKALQDVGEMAARFGVPYSFTRSGKVIYSDGFESSLSPWQVLEGAGYGTVELDTTVSYRGNNSVKFTPSADTNYLAAIQKTTPYVVQGKVGLEVLVAGMPDAEYAQLLLGFRIDDWFTYYSFYLYFPTTKLMYKDSDNNKHEIVIIGGDAGSDGHYHHLMKIVVDPESGEYDYVQLNNTRVSLAGIAGYTWEEVGVDKILVGLAAQDTQAAEGVLYMDDLTLSIDEP